jgi:aminoglycoside phosphotransferase (APT) family kinase protein
LSEPWQPDHPVDEALARALVAAQFPQCAAAKVERGGAGWDVDVWRFGDVAFRFPRRAIAVPLVENELRVLRRLAPLLPVGVPRPTLIGAPSARFAAPFYGHPWLAGQTADRAPLNDASRAALAVETARLLGRLHAIDPRAVDAPRDPFRGDLSRRAARALARLEALPPRQVAAARRLLDPPPPDASGVATTLLHGDLYARHLLVDGARRLTGVIDWGDVCHGDPAIDLAIAYTLVGAGVREAFFAAYGPVDPATRRRARHIGLARYGILLGAYARDVGDRALDEESGRALAHALDD